MGFSREDYAIISLNLVKDVGPKLFRRLVQYFGSAENVINASLTDFYYIEDITPEFANKIFSNLRKVNPEKEIMLANNTGVKILTYLNPLYPEVFKNYDDSPSVIYVRGEMKHCDFISVAMVGTRNPTNYGRNAAIKFAKEFADYKITVISGLARGIDTEAHNSTLLSGGRTIAVLGNGLNKHYPPENRRLEDKIINNGALISEFSMDSEPDKANFPRRNRIISGLSLATLVIESDIKSGALITAKHALNQGKDVFAVPGPIFSKYSSGPHYLLKSGAHLADNTQDIIEEIKPIADWLKKKKLKKIVKNEKEDTLMINENGKQIIDILDRNSEGASVDFIIRQLRFSPALVAKELLDLELRGLVRSHPGKIYTKIN